MSIALDDKAVDVFKLYNELVVAYSQDIEGYKTLLKAIEAMIAQKEDMLRGIKDKTVDLVKTSLEITAPPKPRLRKKGRRNKSIAVNKETVAAGDEIEEAVIEIAATPAESQPLEIIPAIIEQVQKQRAPRQKKEAGKGKVKKVAKPEKPSRRFKKIAEAKTPDIKKSEKPAKAENEIKCLYHPESAAVDIQRQLCSSCRWKLRSNGLTEYDKDPTVVSFLKGETKSIPNVGQPMCPVHPEVPAYNKKTGLCQRCQSKAKAIGVTDRHLTEEELTKLRNPSIKM
jgi:hypothetical protein